MTDEKLRAWAIQLSTWTAHAPAAPGWYWCRAGGGAPSVVEVVLVDGELRCLDDVHSSHTSRLAVMDEWSGPIPDPSEFDDILREVASYAAWEQGMGEDL